MNTIDLPALHPFSGFDVGSLLAIRAETHAEHPFLVFEAFDEPPVSWTYARFNHDANCIAAGLATRGVTKGDKILIHLDNCPELILAWFACAKLGAVAVTTNSRSVGDEVSYFADHSGAVGGITQPKYAEMVAKSATNLKWLSVTETDGGAAERPANAPDAASSFMSLYGDDDDVPAREPNAADPAAVFYTSGTTSRPKGVLLTHANMLWGAKVNAAQQRMHPSDVTLGFLPLFHINAQAYSLFPTLWTGSTVVFQPRFSVSRFWDVATRHGCTWASMVTFCIKVLAEREVPDNKFRLWGDAMCDQPTDGHFGIKTLGWFGMTETVARPICGDPYQPNLPLSMGRPAPEYGISVVDENGVSVPPGGDGELRIAGIRGMSLFAEYLDNPEATADSFDEQGRFMTGDRVLHDESGAMRYLDRLKDMLKVGGENVGASEIERVVRAVSPITDAAVVGKKDDLRGELPVVFVTKDEGAPDTAESVSEAVLAACREKLADFKVPVEVHLVDALPRGTLEKVNKVELRRRLNEPGGA